MRGAAEPRPRSALGAHKPPHAPSSTIAQRAWVDGSALFAAMSGPLPR